MQFSFFTSAALLALAASIEAAPAHSAQQPSSQSSSITIHSQTTQSSYSNRTSIPQPATSSNNSTSGGNSTSNGAQVIAQMQAKYNQTTPQLLSNKTGTCDPSKLQVRKSYSVLTPAERTAYLKAATCLHQLPSNTTDKHFVPGAVNRMDDYTYAHINQTNFIHNSGLLLPWHRQFIWAYEQSLRQECNYTGPMPYWDWTEFADDQTKSPVWDGSKTSFGGNGKAVAHGVVIGGNIPGLPTPIPPPPRPAGTGGGCVENLGGLSSNWTITLGPVSPANNSNSSIQTLFGLVKNTRCLKRDFLQSASSANLTADKVAAVLQQPDIHTFHPLLEITQHLWAHSFGGADIGDLFTTPNDPVFYLLHTQLDRIWALWQGQDYASRMNALDGTVTFFNDPPSANATTNTVMKFSSLMPDMEIGDAMSTVAGPYCYIYA